MSEAHVVVLSPTAWVGGAERSLLEVVRRAPPALRFTVVVPESGPLEDAARAAGAAVVVVPWPAALLGLGERARGRVPLGGLLRAAVALPALVGRLRGALAALEPTVVLSNGIKAHALAALARRSPVAVVWYGREGLEGRRLSALVLRALGRRCDASIAISRYVSSEMRRVLPRSVRIDVLPNVVDLDAFRPGLPLPPDLRKEDGTVWFGVVGALTPVKGQDVFLDAAARVAAVAPQARFLLIGSAPYASEAGLGFERSLRERADGLGLGTRVAFLGERADAARIIAGLDVLVQPNRGPEGLGRAVLEAMACAVPVVTVDRWGPAEIVRDGATGLLVPPGDVTALADAMTRLADDPALRERLGAAGRGWATTHLDSDRIVGGFVDALRPLLAS